MNKTNVRQCEQPIAVDADKLAAMLSCGKYTARKIGQEANARVEVGGRVLYLVQRVQDFLVRRAG